MKTRAPATTAFWIEPNQERYGERLRASRRAFRAAEREPEAGGIVLDPLHYAEAAWEAATSPAAGPPYVRFHPRILGATCHRPAGTPAVVAVVAIATPPPIRLPPPWQGWRRCRAGERPVAPPFDRRAVLATLEVRVPVMAELLPTPARPQAPELPNLADAQAAVEALVDSLNAAVTPIVRAVEAVELTQPDR